MDETQNRIPVSDNKIFFIRLVLIWVFMNLPQSYNRHKGLQNFIGKWLNLEGESQSWQVVSYNSGRCKGIRAQRYNGTKMAAGSSPFEGSSRIRISGS
jgi:hypothetical protein